MAQYSARKGPTANWPIPAVDTDIPQLTITKYFDSGPVLIIYHLIAGSGAVPPGVCIIKTFIDNVYVPALESLHPMAASDPKFFNAAGLLSVTPGRHTIKLTGFVSTADPLTRINANQGRLSVIQLPIWDLTGDVSPL